VRTGGSIETGFVTSRLAEKSSTFNVSQTSWATGGLTGDKSTAEVINLQKNASKGEKVRHLRTVA